MVIIGLILVDIRIARLSMFNQECCKFMQIHVILRTFFDENQQSLKFVMLQTEHRNSIFHGPSIVQVDLCILL